MRKKITKKLALSKETLRNLSADDLRAVVGGMTENLCAISNEATCGCASGECAATNPSNRFACR